MRTKYSSDAERSAILNYHGQITSLATKFALEDPNTPFKIYIRPKIANPEIIDLIVDCKLLLDSVSSNLPMNLQQWTPTNIVELAITAIDLATYDVYWASGLTPA